MKTKVTDIAGKRRLVDLSLVTITHPVKDYTAFWDTEDRRIVLAEDQKEIVLNRLNIT